MNATDTEPADFYKDRRVLITGGIGFIGSNLAHELVRRGARVTVVDSLIETYGGNLFNLVGIEDDIRVNISDVRDQHAMSYLVREADILFNLAGQTSHMDSMTDPVTDLDINCRAQLSILEACRHHQPDIKVVFASTRQIYGKPDYLPVDERHLLHPTDVNGINKMAGEWYHILYNNVYGVRSCSIRLTNTYGPRMRVKDARQTFLGIWVKRILDGDPVEVWGDGLQIRDFTYVDDCVEALLRCGSSPQSDGEIFNLGSDETINLENLAALLVEVHGSGSYDIVPFPADRKPIDIGDYYGDYRWLQGRLGWKPTVSLADGLERTLAFYSEHIDNYL